MLKYFASAMILAIAQSQNCAVCWDGSTAVFEDNSCVCPAAVPTNPTPEDNEPTQSNPNCTQGNVTACNQALGQFDFTSCKCAFAPISGSNDDETNIDDDDSDSDEDDLDWDDLTEEQQDNIATLMDTLSDHVMFNWVNLAGLTGAIGLKVWDQRSSQQKRNNPDQKKMRQQQNQGNKNDKNRGQNQMPDRLNNLALSSNLFFWSTNSLATDLFTWFGVGANLHKWLVILAPIQIVLSWVVPAALLALQVMRGVGLQVKNLVALLVFNLVTGIAYWNYRAGVIDFIYASQYLNEDPEALEFVQKTLDGSDSGSDSNSDDSSSGEDSNESESESESESEDEETE